MHRVGSSLLALTFFAAGLLTPCLLLAEIASTPATPDQFRSVFAAGQRDAAGRMMGGTEMRVLARHRGKLFAGNGYWKDRPGGEGAHGAQILVLDRAGGRWQVDQDFAERMGSGFPRDLAISALREVRFTTDWRGERLAAPVDVLLTASWDLIGTTRAFARDDATGQWSAATLAHDAPRPNFLPQLRSFGEHVDQVTGISLVFAGQEPRGIFSGGYDPSLLGRVRWSGAPELNLADVKAEGLSGTNAGLRVTSFAECNGHLYAAVGQAIYERSDGATPRWRPIYSNPAPGHSETGLRGLTAIPNPAGGEVLLAAVEGSAARIIRIDPRDGSATTELDLNDELRRVFGLRVDYVIAAYNDMTRVREANGGEALLIGLEAFVAPKSPVAATRKAVDVGYGKLERGGWYLVRHGDGHYDLRQIEAQDQALVAVRSILVSPFSEEPDAIYFAGYDANKAPAHDTAWVIRATAATALRAVSR
jgi:hypothetical protein